MSKFDEVNEEWPPPPTLFINFLRYNSDYRFKLILSINLVIYISRYGDHRSESTSSRQSSSAKQPMSYAEYKALKAQRQ